MRIATWNLERPRSNGPQATEKNSLIVGQMEAIDADIWILTETNAAIGLSDYHSIATPPRSFHRPGENAVTIWSRYPIHRVPTFSWMPQGDPTTQPTYAINGPDDAIAVCVDCETAYGALRVYGTIITWHADKGVVGAARQWQEQYASIAAHDDDWAKLNVGLPMCVAGDFNTTLAAAKRGSYGTRQGRAQLRQALERSNLVCVTDNNPDRIDHICLSERWLQRVQGVGCWSAPKVNEKPVTDHNGVWVDIT